MLILYIRLNLRANVQGSQLSAFSFCHDCPKNTCGGPESSGLKVKAIDETRDDGFSTKPSQLRQDLQTNDSLTSFLLHRCLSRCQLAIMPNNLRFNDLVNKPNVELGGCIPLHWNHLVNLKGFRTWHGTKAWTHTEHEHPGCCLYTGWDSLHDRFPYRHLCKTAKLTLQTNTNKNKKSTQKCHARQAVASGWG